LNILIFDLNMPVTANNNRRTQARIESSAKSQPVALYAMPTKFGEREFSLDDSAAWNQLAQHTRKLSSLSVIKRKLKLTHSLMRKKNISHFSFHRVFNVSTFRPSFHFLSSRILLRTYAL